VSALLISGSMPVPTISATHNRLGADPAPPQLSISTLLPVSIVG
jgi:hypothetical protein